MSKGIRLDWGVNMTDAVKNFIEENIYLIENNQWEEVYQKAINDLEEDTGKFTEVIFDIGVHPEYCLTELPAYFLYDSDIKEFIIPDGVTYIGASAFAYCYNLRSVTIPDSVTSIGEYALAWCHSLRSIKYCSTEEQWQRISKGLHWELMSAPSTITYDCKGM